MVKKHKALLKAAKEMFGSIVKCAYIYVDDDETDKFKYLKDNAVKVNANGTIEYNYAIVLEFNNGKKVLLNTSEDAWLKNL